MNWFSPRSIVNALRRLPTHITCNINDALMSFPRFCREFRTQQMQNVGNGPPFVHLSRPNSGQLFLIYGGMDAYRNGGSICSMGLLKFLQVTGLASRNLTWIRDPYFNNYAQGFNAEIPDLASLEQWHRQHVASLPHVREIYTLGYSSGSYGALLFGHLLRAKTVFAFSPRTAVTEYAADRAAQQALHDRLLEDNHVSDYQLWYARRNGQDRQFAMVLSDCPGVRLQEQTRHGATHFLLDRMILHGEFQPLLPPDPGIAAVSPIDTNGDADSRSSPSSK